MEKFGRKLDFYESGQVKKGVEFGLECWEDVFKYTLDDLKCRRKIETLR
ncbi:MAG: hypothetical protein NC828_06265 [Candidatus Omnitrophica bacterium]|nr:hypothetical protein [Candidatus Omnitrophota bacterium]